MPTSGRWRKRFSRSGAISSPSKRIWRVCRRSRGIAWSRRPSME
jgi:hypothetical protein